ncbi:MAG: peptidoglycan-binding protein [Endozoicomonadaceae bacterium]|nr:peptidoglycan-binding protein [Endozoicomonadaceae bacterium]
MNITSKLSIASFALVGLFATGCSQQQVNGGGSGGSQVAGSGQQVQNAPVEAAPAPAPEPVAAVSNPNSHSHPAIPGCTNSITHTHPNGASSHNHKYGCKGRGQAGNRYTHSHPAVPQCTKSIKHTHKYNNRNHTHKYSCKGGAGANAGNNVNVHALQRKLKAKGFYRGPINGVVTPDTRSALQRYMQNR